MASVAVASAAVAKSLLLLPGLCNGPRDVHGAMGPMQKDSWCWMIRAGVRNAWERSPGSWLVQKPSLDEMGTVKSEISSGLGGGLDPKEGQEERHVDPDAIGQLLSQM
ncbi:hypothetical protein H920_12297 [Fukomys damarensis]|uniref:Uncharacterized protein n=1 Tax=Fukomys damarensis TaxID=885580 RepID=A0A091D766_FUKDA|nr:hypothetical protein H920_12297 [Fukomys damarensis]